MLLIARSISDPIPYAPHRTFNATAWDEFARSVRADARAPAAGRDALVLGIGAHYHKNLSAFRSNLDSWTRHLARTFDGALVWQEYATSHFDSPDGSFESALALGREQQPCRPVATNRAYNEYNAVAREVLATNFQERKRDYYVLATFNMTLARWDAHAEKCETPTPGAQCARHRFTDCRHYIVASSRCCAPRSTAAVAGSSVTRHMLRAFLAILANVLEREDAPDKRPEKAIDRKEQLL